MLSRSRERGQMAAVPWNPSHCTPRAWHVSTFSAMPAKHELQIVDTRLQATIRRHSILSFESGGARSLGALSACCMGLRNASMVGSHGDARHEQERDVGERRPSRRPAQFPSSATPRR